MPASATRPWESADRLWRSAFGHCGGGVAECADVGLERGHDRHGDAKLATFDDEVAGLG
jgi:hypothetical protein